jgi:hypothetical protein
MTILQSVMILLIFSMGLVCPVKSGLRVAYDG